MRPPLAMADVQTKRDHKPPDRNQISAMVRAFGLNSTLAETHGDSQHMPSVQTQE